MKYLFFLLLTLISITTHSENNIQDFESLDFEKVRADTDTIKQQIDSSVFYIKATCDIIVLECKQFGIIKTIQMNLSIFLPFLVFVGFFCLWLRNRKRC